MYKSFFKRFFDLFFSSLLFLIFILPVTILFVIASIDTRSCGIFSQVRIGKLGKPFILYKIRSMRIHNIGLGLSANNSSHITRFGYFIRRYKLDELPQLLNILKGNMSFVGPRPDIPRVMQLIPKHQRKNILKARPGLSSEASIEFKDEEYIMSSHEDPEKKYFSDIFPRKIALNIDYVNNISFARDLKVLFGTLLVFKGIINTKKK
jgi:lipopolysaccharide/colanic/teichoic acid biosynthesis glycosyltransferase